MRAIIFGLITLTFVTATSAQGGKKLIFWSGDPNCGVKSRAIVDPATVKCEQISTERGPVSKISYGGVILSVAFLENDDKLIVGASIKNTTSEIIGFDPDMWGAAHFKTKSGFYAGEKPLAAETSLPSRDMIREMSSDGRLVNSIGEFIAETQMTAETRRVRRPDGTEYIRTTIIPDKAAREAEARQKENRNETLSNEQRRIRSTALTVRSVGSNSSVKGLVYFRAHRKSEFVIYSLKVADTTFVFQLPRVAR